MRSPRPLARSGLFYSLEARVSKRPKPRPSPALRLTNWAGIAPPRIREITEWYAGILRAAGLID